MSATQPQRHAISAVDVPAPLLRPKTAKDAVEEDSALEEAVNGEGELDEGENLE